MGEDRTLNNHMKCTEHYLASNKRQPGPCIHIFYENKFLGLDRLCLIIASRALTESLKEDLATLAAFLLGQLGISNINRQTITFLLFRKGKSPTTFFPNVSSGFEGNLIINSWQWFDRSLWTLNPLRIISFKLSSLVVVFNCSSRVIGGIAALLPQPLGLQPVNFIFNALFLDMVKIYLFEHGRKITELTFNSELLCNVLASSSQ